MTKGNIIKGLIAIACITAVAMVGKKMFGGAAESDQMPTFMVQRGPLEINVLQGGKSAPCRMPKSRARSESRPKS